MSNRTLNLVRQARRSLPLLAGVLASCSGDSGAWPDGIVVDTLEGGGVQVWSPAEGVWGLTGAEPWRIEEELRIGEIDVEGPSLFGSVRNVIPDAQGRIWVMDSQARELRLFDADGHFLRTVGGRGDGPGEFASNPCAFPGPNGEVWVEDFRSWHRFDAQGDHIATLLRTNTTGCDVRHWTPDGRLVMVNGEGSIVAGNHRSFFVVYALSDDGRVVPGDTFPTPDLPASRSITWTDPSGLGVLIVSIPFVHRPTWVLGPMGDVFATDGGGAYQIRRTSLAGDTLLIMGRPFEPTGIADSVRNAAIEGAQREGWVSEPSFSGSLVPTVYPPFHRFFIGPDGTVWARSERGDRHEALDVFAPDGRYLGAAHVPEDFDRMYIEHMVGDHMYGRVRDELGIAYAVRLAVRKP